MENEKKQYKPSEVLKIFGNSLYEIRILSKYTQSIYTTDFESIDNKIISALRNEQANVYFSLNELNPALHSRPQSESFQSGKKMSTTSDNDIVSYRWILIDFDPVRPSDVASSEEERYKCLLLAREVYKAFLEMGLPENSLIVADSGNGYHLLIRVDVPNTHENVETVKHFLQSLDMMFSTDSVKVDIKNFNPSRITKMYGTYSCKGMSTKERPHRLSNLISVPKSIEICPFENVEKVSRLSKDRVANNSAPVKHTGTGNFDANEFLSEFIAKHNIQTIKDTTVNGIRRVVLAECPFDANHKRDSMIGVADNKPFFTCFHSGCGDKHWQDFRLLYEPNYLQEQEEKQRQWQNERNAQRNQKNHHSGVVNVIDMVADISNKSPVVQQKKESGSPLDKSKPWYSLKDGLAALNYEGDEQQGFSTGFKAFDNYLEGGILSKGTFSIISGDSGSGKTTFINQLVLNVANQGHKVAIYSGELDIKRFTKWITRQACGTENMVKSRAGNLYVPADVAEKIAEWSEKNIQLYNNLISQKVSEIIKQVIWQIENNGSELIIIDNLMSMETDELGKDFGIDKQIVQASVNVAKNYNVHIILVAHPRKASGYLRKDDISGEKNITNLADNVFIMHRVNADFTRAYYEYKTGKKWYEGCNEEFGEYDNVLEICKNRDSGAIDKKIPFYFDVESRRFLESRGERRVYGWQSGFIPQKEIDDIGDMPY